MDEKITFTVPESLAVSDSGFLFLASSGETFTLNQIGKEIFAMMKEGGGIASIKDHVLAEYDVDPKTLERDIEDFITQLKRHKLVTAP